MRSSTFYILICLALILVGGVAGFFMGRGVVKVEEKTVISYKEMPMVSVSVKPDIARYSIPEFPRWIIVDGKIDSAAIVADWIVKREYKGTTGNDTVGHVKWSAVVQYNQLPIFNLDFMPIQRTVTTTRTIERRVTPFVLVGGNSEGFGQLEAGVFFRNWGIAAELGTDFNGRNYFGGKAGFWF